MRKYLILIIKNYSQKYCHQPKYGTSLMTKVTKKSNYQMIILSIQTIFVLSYWTCGIKERENFNTDYAMTSWMLCIITHIRENIFNIVQNKYNIQMNIIKSLFAWSTEKELHETLDMFWREYIKFNNKNDPIDSNDFVWNSRYIFDVNSHLWNQ